MCVFCQIISQEIPCYEVYEDQKALAFLDIKPSSPGHTLVVPKNHYSNLEEISEEDLSALIVAVKKAGQILKDRLGVSDYNVVVNNGSVAGQIVDHLHFHIIPRQENDGLPFPSGRPYQPGEAEAIVDKLTKI